MTLSSLWKRNDNRTSKEDGSTETEGHLTLCVFYQRYVLQFLRYVLNSSPDGTEGFCELRKVLFGCVTSLLLCLQLMFGLLQQLLLTNKTKMKLEENTLLLSEMTFRQT